MWILNNQTPFAAERTWVRDENGAEVWLVAVKGSFVLEPDGKQVLDKNQSEVSRIPVFIGEEGKSSLLYDSDLVHKKKSTDVLIHGHAYSPKGRNSKSILVRLKVAASIDKNLLVQGDRRWSRGLLGVGLSEAEPFTKMPITYERAFGGSDPIDEGWEPRNPVGTGFAKHKENIVGDLAPNIDDPRRPYKDCCRGQPAGFGPIARHWSPRVELAGTYDEEWELTKSPLLPSDFDEKFYQSAPEDQQVPGFLNGGELVELSNLTPEGYLSFHLPKVSIGIRTRFYDGSEVHQRAELHTLIIQPDERKFQIVWHTNLPCHQKVNQLKETTIILKKRTQIAHAELAAGMWSEELENG